VVRVSKTVAPVQGQAVLLISITGICPVSRTFVICLEKTAQGCAVFVKDDAYLARILEYFLPSVSKLITDF
jgi:hypothetical protein